MSHHIPRYETLKSAEKVDVKMWQKQLAAFIKSFVVREKQQRWHHLCIDKPAKAARESSKLHNDLNWNRCRGISLDNELNLTKQKSKGIFYDFSGEAWWLLPSEAFEVGHGYDSLFLIKEGALAIYFFHELEDILCEK